MDMLDNSGHVDKDTFKRTTIPNGYLCQMTSLQASLILAGLKEWQTQAAQSRHIASVYAKSVKDRGVYLRAPILPKDTFNTYLQFPIWVDDSNQKLKKWLREQKVDINVDFFRDVSSLECFAEYGCENPNTQLLLKHLALLPTYPRQDARYTGRVSQSLEEFDTRS